MFWKEKENRDCQFDFVPDPSHPCYESENARLGKKKGKYLHFRSFLRLSLFRGLWVRWKVELRIDLASVVIILAYEVVLLHSWLYIRTYCRWFCHFHWFSVICSVTSGIAVQCTHAVVHSRSRLYIHTRICTIALTILCPRLRFYAFSHPRFCALALFTCVWDYTSVLTPANAVLVRYRFSSTTLIFMDFHWFLLSLFLSIQRSHWFSMYVTVFINKALDVSVRECFPPLPPRDLFECTFLSHSRSYIRAYCHRFYHWHRWFSLDCSDFRRFSVDVTDCYRFRLKRMKTKK